jgi:hypothetical protein
MHPNRILRLLVAERLCGVASAKKHIAVFIYNSSDCSEFGVFKYLHFHVHPSFLQNKGRAVFGSACFWGKS